MGTFNGHIFSGTLYMIFGNHWLVAVYNRYFRSLLNQGSYANNSCKGWKYRSSATYPFCWYTKYPVEGWFKIVSVIIGILTEFYTGLKNDTGYWYFQPENAQHMIMYSMFLINGLVDVLMTRKGTLLPRNSDYATLLLGTVVTGMLFYNHNVAESVMSMKVHKLHVALITANGVFTVLEMKYQNNVVIAFFRAWTLLLMSSWLWAIAFIEFNPWPNHKVWGLNGHTDMLLVMVVFFGNLLINFGAAVFVGFVVYLKYRKMFIDKNSPYQKLNGTQLNEPLMLNGSKCVHDADTEDEP